MSTTSQIYPSLATQLQKRCRYILLLPLLWGGNVMALPFLFDWGLNIDGITTCFLGPCDTDGVELGGVSGVDDTGFDYDSGLGIIDIEITGTGTHYVGLFLDHDLGVDFDDDSATTAGSPAGGQSWEMDEPGFTTGDIFDNFTLSQLDNMIGPTLNQPEDVSMALAWDFLLAAGQSASLQFRVAETDLASGLRLIHSEDSLSPPINESIYMSSALTINPANIPLPGTLLLLVTGLLSYGATCRRVSHR